jgi:hypothetical protein
MTYLEQLRKQATECRQGAVAAKYPDLWRPGSRRSIPPRCAPRRVPQQSADQTLVHRLERDDVLAVGQHHPSDRDLVHLADGLANHRESVVADLAVGTQVVGPDQVAGVDLGLVDELVISMVRVDSRAMSSSSSLDTSTNTSLSSM